MRAQLIIAAIPADEVAAVLFAVTTPDNHAYVRESTPQGTFEVRLPWFEGQPEEAAKPRGSGPFGNLVEQVSVLDQMLKREQQVAPLRQQQQAGA